MRTIAILIWISCAAFGQAQGGWERVLTELNDNNAARDVIEMPDGSILTIVLERNQAVLKYSSYLVRFDSDGDLVNQKKMLQNAYSLRATSLHFLTDRNLFLSGIITEVKDGPQEVFGMKITPTGDIIWEQRYAADLPSHSTKVQSISNEDGFIIIADLNLDANDVAQPLLIRISTAGETLWTSEPWPENEKISYDEIAFAADGSIYMVSQDQFGFERNTNLYHIDLNGQLLNQKDLSFTDPLIKRGANRMQVLPDSGLILFSHIDQYTSSEFNDYLRIYKFDNDFNEVWEKELDHIPVTDYLGNSVSASTSASWVMPNADSLFLLINYNRYDSQDLDTSLHRRYFYTFDPDGNILYEKIKPIFSHQENHHRLLAGNNNSLISCGSRQDNYTLFSGPYSAQIIKYDWLGNSLANALEGNIYIDENEDCNLAATEPGISGWQVVVQGDNQIYAGSTDGFGNYYIDVGTGDYQLSVTAPVPYWNICNGLTNISYTNSNETFTRNFGAQPSIDCPMMWVDLATPFLRNCFDNTYQASYCNLGTVDAVESFININLEEGLSISNATEPYSTLTDGTIVFDLGLVEVLDCGNFSFDVYVDCDNIELGQTLCVAAQIFPDTICNPDPNWSGASITVSGECINDESILYKIENVGDAPTSSDLKYIVIEDHVIMSQGTVNLNPLELFELPVSADGSTYRLEVEQEAFHPGNSSPSLSIEGCGGLTPGLINSYSLDDGNLHTDIDCKEVIGSYDPNDKTGYPLGYASENYIDKNTDLEYLIRFQNVGTDTAFRVVIRDTISQLLDLSSIRAGSSSHPYEFSIENGGIIKFIFSDILLPDSTTDLNDSNGFVEFKIKQNPNNQIGDVIRNSAGIYFDFNPPVITNKTKHTIAQVLIDNVNYIGENEKEATLQVYPNPFSAATTFAIESQDFNFGQLNLYDIHGKLVRQQEFKEKEFSFNRRNIPAGIYAFVIQLDGVDIMTGKIVIQ